MIKNHTVELEQEDFNFLSSNSYIITDLKDLNQFDYVLFTCKPDELAESDSEVAYHMCQVNELMQDDGFKDGFYMLKLSMLS